MDVRRALMEQSPSLVLQRSAQDLISQQDAHIDKLVTALHESQDTITSLTNVNRALEAELEELRNCK